MNAVTTLRFGVPLKRQVARSALAVLGVLWLAGSLTACGGGSSTSVALASTGNAGGGATTTVATSTSTVTATSTGTSNVTASPTTSVPTTTSTTGLLLTGIAYPLKTNDSVHVPAGTIITTINGASTTINATDKPINVPGGSFLTVPITATGPANILVTAIPGQPDDLAITLPTITVLAGSPTEAGPPADGVGTAARFWGFGHLAVEASGNVLVTESAALKRITPDGAVTTISTAYVPYDWEGIAVGKDGSIYGSGTSWAPLPDNYGATLQRLSPTGVLTTMVSNWVTSPTITTLGQGGLAVDALNNLYLTDARNHRILKFSATGVMSVYAGIGQVGYADGTTAKASFSSPNDLAIDAAGNLYVADTGNAAVRKITPTGVVTTLARQLNMGAIAASPAGVVYFVGGQPRTLVRISADQSRTVVYPPSSFKDTLTGLAADAAGNVYAGTRGEGAQIVKISF
jgi:sugar lactone lactonase YvrE